MNCVPALPGSDLIEAEERTMVVGGELAAPSQTALAGCRSVPAVSRKPRLIRGVLGSAIVVSAVFVLGWPLWHVSHPNTADGHWAAVVRGRDALRRGRPDLALREVNSIRDDAPGSGESMTVAGFALLRLGEYRGARLALERAIKLEPKQFDAAITLAELDFGLGNGQRGIEVLEMAARLRPKELRIWLTMGKVLNDLGDLPKAIDAYERAVDLDPENRDALIGLIGCLISNSQTDLAQPWVTKALAKDPDDPKVLGFAALRIRRESIGRSYCGCGSCARPGFQERRRPDDTCEGSRVQVAMGRGLA